MQPPPVKVSAQQRCGTAWAGSSKLNREYPAAICHKLARSSQLPKTQACHSKPVHLLSCEVKATRVSALSITLCSAHPVTVLVPCNSPPWTMEAELDVDII